MVRERSGAPVARRGGVIAMPKSAGAPATIRFTRDQTLGAPLAPTVENETGYTFVLTALSGGASLAWQGETPMATAPPPGTRFAAFHRHDRAMAAGVVAIVWLAIVAGFGIDMVKRAQAGELSFPLIVHLHVAAYSAWLVLLAVQVWLVRTRRVAQHRSLGRAALVLLPLMLVLGPATALVQARNPWMPDRWIAWLSVNFTNAIGSVALLAAGLVLRRDAAAHKRLMLMGTIAVTEPGFSRIWLPYLSARLGEGYWRFYLATYVGTLALVIAVGVYDYATRRRLHPAYLAAALWIVANEMLATWLFYQPFWMATAKRMTGHSV
jgi:hypothetical protein